MNIVRGTAKEGRNEKILYMIILLLSKSSMLPLDEVKEI